MANNFSDLLSSDTAVSHALRKLDLVGTNPASVQQTSLELLQQYLTGESDIVDATNPFMKLLESSAINTAGFIIDNEVTTRAQYPSCAQTMEDLYLHMSDKDYIDRFASPAVTKFNIVVPMKQILASMVTDTATGIKKIVIPRNSEFIIENTVFSIQYPIEIKQLLHGGIQVVYNTDAPSPLQSLETNVVDHKITKIKNLEDDVLLLEIDVIQFSIKSKMTEINSTKLMRQTIDFNDQYYYTRVYYKNNATQGRWIEIKTTHTDQVYDINEVTAVLKVTNNKLDVYIPQIYFTAGMVSGSVRVDIYQTKGEVSLSLDKFKPSSFKARWIAIDKADQSAAVAAWVKIPDVFVYSNETVYGGKNQLSFENLRRRVMTNAIGDRNVPITNAQIVSHIENRGFDIVKTVDLVTNRIFQATRALPKPFDEKLITSAATSMESVVLSMEAVKGHPAVFDNGSRVTLTPDLLYRNNNGIITPVPASTVSAMLSKPADVIAMEVNADHYLYTPFHYVLDAAQKDFDVRPYYMGKPEFKLVEFVDQNDATMLQVNTNKFTITKTVYGYQVLLETKSNDTFKALGDDAVHVQLSFVPVYEASRVYLNGTLVTKLANGERIFKFDIQTNYDIDHRNILFLNSFNMFNSGTPQFGAHLSQEFDIVYSSSAMMNANWLPHSIDSYLGRFLLPSTVAAVTHEKATFTFGKHLQYLWTSNRSISSSAAYERWTSNVPAIYEEDVYVKNPVTNSIFAIGPNNELIYDFLHKKGDPVLGPNNEQIFKHRIGDPKLNTRGELISVGEKFVSRQLDIMFVEGLYYFSTDSASTVYRETFINTVVNWITYDIVEMNRVGLEQTNIFFYPKSNLSNIRVMVENGTVTELEASQAFNVKLYVSKQVYENSALCMSITNTTIKTLDTYLKRETVSVSAIVSALKSVYGEDVISISLTGLGGAMNLNALTVLSAGDRCSVKKRLSSIGDGKLIVQEDVNVEFVQHALV